MPNDQTQKNGGTHDRPPRAKPAKIAGHGRKRIVTRQKVTEGAYATKVIGGALTSIGFVIGLVDSFATSGPLTSVGAAIYLGSIWVDRLARRG